MTVIDRRRGDDGVGVVVAVVDVDRRKRSRRGGRAEVAGRDLREDARGDVLRLRLGVADDLLVRAQEGRRVRRHLDVPDDAELDATEDHDQNDPDYEGRLGERRAALGGPADSKSHEKLYLL